MKTRVSFWDRWSRAALGAVVFLSGVLRPWGLHYDLGVILAVVGLVMLLTGLTGTCTMGGICGLGWPRGGGNGRDNHS